MIYVDNKIVNILQSLIDELIFYVIATWSDVRYFFFLFVRTPTAIVTVRSVIYFVGFPPRCCFFLLFFSERYLAFY